MNEVEIDEYLSELKMIKPYFENDLILIPFNSYPRVAITKESFVWIESTCFNDSYKFPKEQLEQYRLWLQINSLLKF